MRRCHKDTGKRDTEAEVWGGDGGSGSEFRREEGKEAAGAQLAPGRLHTQKDRREKGRASAAVAEEEKLQLPRRLISQLQQ